MNILLLMTLLLFSSYAFNMSSFNGSLTFTLANDCYDSILFSNASFLFCSNMLQNMIQVYKNSGHGFTLFETIITPGNARFLTLAEAEGQLWVTSYPKIFVYSNISGTPHFETEIDTGSTVRQISFLNGFIITCHIDQNMRFYRPSDYSLAKTLDSGLAKVTGFSETNDQSLLAAGNIDGILRIFSFDGLNYLQTQEVDVEFGINFVSLTHDRLIFTGEGGKICIYEKSGVAYTESQVIQTH